ncbi:MAG: preprotein translocase subunit TatB [Betaproteobacteria bacterium RIFCSPLOWO2_12_FULL_64_23]|nr:MAG: preprotein translocase subunit TatB [Betaproteobacteria bacterium RIFCSPLOWO2_12_FULL_64_23]
MKFEKKTEGLYALDVCGYVCPHPQLYTKKALEKMKGGELLELVFDNASSGESISAMCESIGNEVVEKNTNSGKYTWKIRKIAA